MVISLVVSEFTAYNEAGAEFTAYNEAGAKVPAHTGQMWFVQL